MSDSLTEEQIARQCPCGGTFHRQIVMRARVCEMCGFILTDSILLNGPRWTVQSYKRHRRHQSDPMHQLPERYWTPKV